MLYPKFCIKKKHLHQRNSKRYLLVQVDKALTELSSNQAQRCLSNALFFSRSPDCAVVSEPHLNNPATRHPGHQPKDGDRKTAHDHGVEVDCEIAHT
jgi:hypothetical protein